MTLTLRSSVGVGGANQPADVLALTTWLAARGYLDCATDYADDPLFKSILLLQSIRRGRRTVPAIGSDRYVDGRLDPGGQTVAWCSSGAAPSWGRLPASGPGWVRPQAVKGQGVSPDGHDFGTSWLADAIAHAGAAYAAKRRSAMHGWPDLAVNDLSLGDGGDTPEHAGHETGLDVDLFLPRIDGTYGAITVRSVDAKGAPCDHPLYDREAMRAQLRAWLDAPKARRALLNDPVLIAEGLCSAAPGHDNHAHGEVGP